MKDIFISWSGGKDSCLAGYLAMKGGCKARYLMNMVTGDGLRSRSHGMTADVIKTQAEAIGIPLVQQPTETENYEANYKKMLKKFKDEGIGDGVLGDIDFNAHKEWIDRVYEESGIMPHLPLWEWPHRKIMDTFLDAGFETVVVATKPDKLGEEWLGRTVDRQFLSEIEKLGVTLCGEAGEFHSLVIDGPIFKKRLEITGAEKVFRDGRWFLDIKKAALRGK